MIDYSEVTETFVITMRNEGLKDSNDAKGCNIKITGIEELFEKSISSGCESSFEHGGDFVYTAEKNKTQWVVSIKTEGPDNRKIIVLEQYKGPYIVDKNVILSFRRSPEKIRLRNWSVASRQLSIKGQKGMSYILSKKQMKMVEDMLDSWARGDFQDWLKK